MTAIKSMLAKLYGVYATVVCALCVALCGVVILLVPGLAWRRHIARWGLRITFVCAGMPFSVHGVSRLPSRPGIAIANHNSYLDGLALIAALPPHFTPVIKAEVRDLPLIGHVLRRVGARYVQREPAMRAGRDTKHLLDALRAGESLAVFPEGTFSVDEGLLPFRDGAFFLAAKAGVPVVPVTMQGTQGVLPPGRVLPRPGAVHVHVLEALHATGDDRAAADALRTQTENVLWHGLEPRTPDLPKNGPDYAYYCRVLRGRFLPLAYLDLDLLEGNIRTLLERGGGKKLRVDARALCCPAVIDRILRSNTRFQGVCCATVHEAVYLARTWVLEDLLVAYPTMQPEAIEQACAAIADGCEITLTIDSVAHLKRLSNAAANAGITVPVCVEVDLMRQRNRRRTPLQSIAAVLALVDEIGAHDALRFRGLLTFDVQHANKSARWAATRSRHRIGRGMGASVRRQVRQRRHALVDRLHARGYASELIGGAGFGATEFNADDESITAITVGSELFSPQPVQANGAPMPAAGFALEVMRHVDENRYACLDSGNVSFGMLAARSRPQPGLPPGVDLETPEENGATHIIVRYGGDLHLGDTLFFRPSSIGMLGQHFNHLLLLQDGAIVDAAATYRALGDALL